MHVREMHRMGRKVHKFCRSTRSTALHGRSPSSSMLLAIGL